MEEQAEMTTTRHVEPIHNLDSAAERCHVSRELMHEWVTQRGLRAFPVSKKNQRPHDYLILDRWITEFLISNAVTRQRNPDGSFMGPRAPTHRGNYGSMEDGSAPLGKCPV
jgi:hypothetical protein